MLRDPPDRKARRTARTAGARGPPDRRDRQGNTGPPIATEVGTASVFVARGDGDPSRWATYAVPLLAPGSTTGGQFRFSCSAAQQPCKVSLGAAVISSETGTTGFYPRLLIHRRLRRAHVLLRVRRRSQQQSGLCSSTACADRWRTPLARLRRPGALSPWASAPRSTVGPAQPEPDGVVTEILVPAGLYDVWATLAFGDVPPPEDRG